MLSTFTVANIMDECFAAAREQRCREIAREIATFTALIVCRCSLVMIVGDITTGIFTAGLGELRGYSAGGSGWKGGGGRGRGGCP